MKKKKKKKLKDVKTDKSVTQLDENNALGVKGGAKRPFKKPFPHEDWPHKDDPNKP